MSPSLTAEYIDHATAEKDYASLNDGEKRFGTVSFMANVAAGSSAVFQMNLLGNGEKLSSFKLYKMTANQKTEYVYVPSGFRIHGFCFWPVVGCGLHESDCRAESGCRA